MRWGATGDEVTAAMPGDDVVRVARFNATRAITIDVPREAVWPWIVQLGYGRAGFYTYDLIDNGAKPSATVVMEQCQDVKVGDLVPMFHETHGLAIAYVVESFETNRRMLWVHRPHEHEPPDSTWSWRLSALPGGRTRLVTRLKQDYRWATPRLAIFNMILMEFGDFAMERRMLKGIKQRAELTGPTRRAVRAGASNVLATARRALRRLAVADVLVGGSQVLAVTLTAPMRRGRYNRWGATEAEVAGRMPGDELVAHPQLGYTRAITIEAPTEHVWPWLVQMGQGRGGLYSFDGLENLVGCAIQSADQILPDFQQLRVGDLIRLGPVGYPCFRVHHVESGASLVLVGADPRPPHPAAAPDSPAGIATWQWQLRPTPDSQGTRLVSRQRLSYPPTTTMRLMWHVVEPVGFVMERQMLRGIKQRAERGRPMTQRPS
jgi:hypothetical protein